MQVDRVKQFISLHRSGTLCTLLRPTSDSSSRLEGYPFGSLVHYDVDEHGRPVVFVSLLAEHYKNLVADSRASLFICDAFGLRDPQAFARATLLATFTQISDSERPAIEARYFARFPESPGRSLAHDFVFFRGEVERVRWIGGFGDIRWVSAEDYRNALFDPISYTGAGAIEHMNLDHRDALRDYARGHCDLRAEEKDIRMVAVDSTKFALGLVSESGERRITIEFPSPLTSPEQLRGAMISELQRCRDLLHSRKNGA